MEPETRYTVIGAVVLSLLAAAVFGYLWLSSRGSAGDFNYYTVYFQKQSLEGLQVGGSVNMRGIAVGRVESYRLSRNDVNRVEVTLRVSRDAPVRENTRASVARNVLTGIARINLETPNTPAPELTKVPEGERYPVIAEGTSNLDQIADSVNHLAQVANKVLDNVNLLLDPKNQQVFAETLVGMRDMVNGVNQRLALLDRTADNVNQTAKVFQQSARELTRSMQGLVASLQPVGADASRTLKDAQAALRQFAQATEKLQGDVSHTLQQLDRSSSGLAQQADQALDTSVLELRATATELRSSADRIARTLERLQDPRAALLGPGKRQLGPGESE